MPNFEAKTTGGDIKFHDWIGDSWAILFSHPADFTPVCTTELSMAQKMRPEFEKRGVKMIALSVDEVESHKGWIADIKNYTNGEFGYTIISDPKREIAVQLGMIDPDEKDKAGMPVTARAVFIIGPDKKMKLSLLYPATTGRNFDEIIRVIDSLQLTAVKKVATPANWNSGQKCMVVPGLTDEQANERFKAGFEKATLPSGKGYIRTTPDPSA